MEQHPFWEFFGPKDSFDVEQLLHRSLPRGERFETRKDAARYREVAIKLLSHPRHGHHRLADTLRECRDGDYQCGEPYCPVCMRPFRIWRYAEFMRLCLAAKGTIHYLTLTVDKVYFDELDGKEHRLKRYTQRVYQQFRQEIPRAIAFGGWEAARKRGTEKVRVHLHLLLLNVTERQIKGFCDRYYGGSRDHLLVQASELPSLVSYVQKFTTYQRPGKQIGGRKPPAVPLPPRLHTRLIKWMDAHTPSDFVFLFNLRRQTTRLKEHPRVRHVLR